DEVAGLLGRAGLRVQRRSSQEAAVATDAQVFLLDTVGELATYFPGARAAFVGGTLAPMGGHNILEPVASGVPVAFGPHLDNVREGASLLEQIGAGVRLAGADDLTRFWGEALADPAAARARGERGRA